MRLHGPISPNNRILPLIPKNVIECSDTGRLLTGRDIANVSNRYAKAQHSFFLVIMIHCLVARHLGHVKCVLRQGCPDGAFQVKV